MKLKNFNCIVGLLIIFSYSPLLCEEKIDIWNNKKDITSENNQKVETDIKQKDKIEASQKIQALEKIQIQEGSEIETKEQQVFGIYEPSNYDFSLNMWSETKAEDLRSSLKRLNKIKLSRASNEILEGILFSFSYPPQGMSEKEFVNLKINWLIKNDRVSLIESFLKQNEQFENKSKAVQYLVDKNIASANIKEGCDKISFIDAKIKDEYLEKFKIYCLIFNNKKPEAQLLLDLLREQSQSSKFYDDKINFLLGVTNKTSKKINDKNLLNFYLSSIIVPNFKYEPSAKTKKSIWEYMNAANLITIEDITDKKKIANIEIAANKNQIDKSQVFKIYKQIPFELNTLINATSVYQSLEKMEGRALIYQKFLLSDNTQKKLDLLFLLKDLFKKENLSNVYTEFLSDRLKEISLSEVPKDYVNIIERNIVSNKSLNQQKIKFDDKTLHRSKLIRYFYEKDYPVKKTQKELDSIYKKIKRNRNYFYSAKDIAVLVSLENDGVSIPKEINHKNLSESYSIPDSLDDLAQKGEKGYLALKIVEIIGEDEVNNLDPETIYFITYLLNKLNLKEFRNEILATALPLRI